MKIFKGNKKNNNSKLERRIALQQKLIDELTAQNELLKQRNEDLQNELDFEKEIPKEGYEKAKNLIIDLEQYKVEYEKSIADLKESKESYEAARQEFYILKKQYQKKMDAFLKQLKKTV